MLHKIMPDEHKKTFTILTAALFFLVSLAVAEFCFTLSVPLYVFLLLTIPLLLLLSPLDAQITRLMKDVESSTSGPHTIMPHIFPIIGMSIPFILSILFLNYINQNLRLRMNIRYITFISLLGTVIDGAWFYYS